MTFNIYLQLATFGYFPNLRSWLYGWGYMKLGRKVTAAGPPVEYRYLVNLRLLGVQLGLVFGHGKPQLAPQVVNGGSSG